MASYFDEHDCEPLRDGQAPDGFLHFARLLIDSGAWNQSEFSALFQDRTPPPASKKFIADLKDRMIRDEGKQFSNYWKSKIGNIHFQKMKANVRSVLSQWNRTTSSTAFHVSTNSTRNASFPGCKRPVPARVVDTNCLQTIRTLRK